jgi:hypothetical protein
VSDSSPQLYPDLAPDLLKQRVARFVLPNERIVIVQRHHLAMIVQPIAVFVAAFLAAVGVDVFSSPDASELRTVFWVVALAAFTFMSWYLTIWLSEYFIVTHKRVMKTTGILSKKVQTLPLGKVVDFSYDQDILGRIFGYGRFNMESAGEHPLGKINFISRPMRTYLEISNLLFGPGAKKPNEPQDVRVIGVPNVNVTGGLSSDGRLSTVQDVRLVEEADVRVTGIVLPTRNHPRVKDLQAEEDRRRDEQRERAERGQPPADYEPADVTEVILDGKKPTRPV